MASVFPRSPCSSHTARGPREQEVAFPHRALKGPPMSVQFSEMKGLNAFCSLRSRAATRSVSFRRLLWRSVPAGVNQGAALAPPTPPLGPAVTEARTPCGAGDGGVGQGSRRPTHWTRRTERERRPPPGPSPPRAPCPSQSHAAPGEAWLLAEVAALSSLLSLRADAVAPPSPHRRRTCLLVGRKCWGH